MLYHIRYKRGGENMSNFIVEFFEKSDGTYPAEEFILSQDLKMKSRLYRTLAVLETDGNNIREPYSKFLGDGIYEVRVQQGNNIARILYFFVVNRKIILTNGFIKKSQKTPKSEINKAKKFRSEYLNMKRSEENE
jgi:hypothetical protein